MRRNYLNPIENVALLHQVPFSRAFESGQLSMASCHRLIAAIAAAAPEPDRWQGAWGHCQGVDWHVCGARPWSMDAAVADSLASSAAGPGAVGRVLLAGDAGHQFPPSGGFGLNTGLQVPNGESWVLVVYSGLFLY